MILTIHRPVEPNQTSPAKSSLTIILCHRTVPLLSLLLSGIKDDECDQPTEDDRTAEPNCVDRMRIKWSNFVCSKIMKEVTDGRVGLRD